jgi:hypothetical protein
MSVPGPWVGVALIGVGLGTAVASAHYHIGVGEVAGAVMALGVAVIQANLHQAKAKEVVMLRESMRPPPSLVDEQERRG